MDSKTLMYITFAIVAAVLVGEALWRRHMYKDFERMFAEGRYDDLLAALDKRTAQFLFQPFNRVFLRMNTHIAKGDEAQASADIDQLLRMKLGKKARQSVVINAYQFYLQNDRYGDAKTMLDEIQETFPADVAKDAQVTYDIYAKKSTAYLDDMLAEYDGADHARKAQLSYLIAIQYQNGHDNKNFAKWREIATRMVLGGDDDGESAGGSASGSASRPGVRIGKKS